MNKAISLVLLLSVLVAQAQIKTHPNLNLADSTQRPPLPYDRIEVLERFIKIIYPDLANKLAMFDIEATFDEGHVNIRHIKFYPCNPVRVIAGSRSAPIAIPLAPQKPAAPPQPPNCFDKPTAEFEHFLEISVELGGGFRERPIWKFNASGNYFAQQQQVGQEFIGNPSFSSDEAIRALLAKQPKYGPEKKQEFIAALPWREIEEITGCRLEPQTAKFVPALGERKYHTLPALQWWVSGTSPGAKRLLASHCSAGFDAFEGRLTDFYD